MTLDPLHHNLLIGYIKYCLSSCVRVLTEEMKLIGTLDNLSHHVLHMTWDSHFLEVCGISRHMQRGFASRMLSPQ